MNHKITKKSAFHIIGMQFRGNNDNNECPKLWESFNKRYEEVIPLTTKPISFFGVCSEFDMEKNIFTYTAGLQVEDVTNIPSGMISMEIPEQEYAVFESTLPAIMETINKIHTEWLPQSEYNRANGPELEFYDAEFDQANPESIFYLYIPVIKKN